MHDARTVSLLFILSMILLVAAPVGAGRAATRCVNPGGTGGCFSSIGVALDARTGNGDLIPLEAGTYTETFQIRGYDTTIEGAGVGATIIEATVPATASSVGRGIRALQPDVVRLARLTIRPAPSPDAPAVSLCIDVVLEDVEIEDRPTLNGASADGHAAR